MKTFNVYRRLTDTDTERLNESAKRFMSRHHFVANPLFGNCPTWADLDDTLQAGAYTGIQGYRRLLRSWRKCMNRALRVNLGHRVGVYSDAVGYWIK